MGWTWRKLGNNNNTEGKIRIENQRFPTLDVCKRREIIFLRIIGRTTSAWNSIIEQDRGWHHKRRTAIQRNSVNWRRGVDKRTPRCKWKCKITSRG